MKPPALRDGDLYVPPESDRHLDHISRTLRLTSLEDSSAPFQEAVRSLNRCAPSYRAADTLVDCSYSFMNRMQPTKTQPPIAPIAHDVALAIWRNNPFLTKEQTDTIKTNIAIGCSKTRGSFKEVSLGRCGLFTMSELVAQTPHCKAEEHTRAVVAINTELKTLSDWRSALPWSTARKVDPFVSPADHRPVET